MWPSSLPQARGLVAGRHAALAARAGVSLTLYSVVSVHANWFVPEVVRPEEETIPIEVRSSVLLRQAPVPVLVVPRGGGWP
jgi:hypothetical protein